MTITKDTLIREVIAANPKAAEVLSSFGMGCVGCPSAAGENIGQAAERHGIKVDELIDRLNKLEPAQNVLPTGAILQRDKQTYAIAPHIPGGITNADTLRKLADVAEKYGAQAIKVTSAQRIALVGIKKEDVDNAWRDLGMDVGHAVGLCVRSVKICPATTFCKRGQQDGVSLGLELDKRYHGMELPSKFKMAVSGCQNSCSEPAVRDLGFIGTPKGYNVMVGGNAGIMPRLGNLLAEHVDANEALAIAEKVINYYKQNARKHERIGRMIDRIGFETFKQAVLG